MGNYLSINSFAESMAHYSPKDESSNLYIIPHGVASNLFIIGSKSVEWLSTWRQTKVFDRSNNYVSLGIIMSTLRQAATGKREMQSRNMVANKLIGSMSEKLAGPDPNDRCELRKHPHKNSEFYKQCPELAPKSEGKKGRWKKEKAKLSAGSDDVIKQDNISDSGISLANVAKVSSASS